MNFVLNDKYDGTTLTMCCIENEIHISIDENDFGLVCCVDFDEFFRAVNYLKNES